MLLKPPKLIRCEGEHCHGTPAALADGDPGDPIRGLGHPGSRFITAPQHGPAAGLSRRSAIKFLVGGALGVVAAAAPRLAEATYQRNWCWCSKCQGLWYAGNGTNGLCPGGGGGHSRVGGRDYVLAESMPSAPGQPGWRWCRKCQGLWYGLNRDKGWCPAQGTHFFAGSGDYRLIESLPNAPRPPGEAGWRWCRRCQGLWFAGNGAAASRCPNGLPHGGFHSEVDSGHYALRRA